MKLNNFFKKIPAWAIGLLLFTSCARHISSDVYAAGQVGEVSTTYPGVIRNARVVLLQNGDQLEDNGLGIIGGGVAGGFIGSAAGRGHFLPTAAGALTGAVVGSLVESKMKEQHGLEYTVELYNGGLVTVVQGTDNPLYVGQPVYVLISPYGRSRIVPQ